MMQQILVGLGALIDPLENSPGFLAGSSNHSFSAGQSNKLWVWNNRKGIALGTENVSLSPEKYPGVVFGLEAPPPL